MPRRQLSSHQPPPHPYVSRGGECGERECPCRAVSCLLMGRRHTRKCREVGSVGSVSVLAAPSAACPPQSYQVDGVLAFPSSKISEPGACLGPYVPSKSSPVLHASLIWADPRRPRIATGECEKKPPRPHDRADEHVSLQLPLHPVFKVGPFRILVESSLFVNRGLFFRTTRDADSRQ